MFEFSSITEEAEAALHYELQLTKIEIGLEDKNKNHVKQTLMTLLLQHPFDLRGRRHLLTVLELYKVGYG